MWNIYTRASTVLLARRYWAAIYLKGQVNYSLKFIKVFVEIEEKVQNNYAYAWSSTCIFLWWIHVGCKVCRTQETIKNVFRKFVYFAGNISDCWECGKKICSEWRKNLINLGIFEGYCVLKLKLLNKLAWIRLKV